MREIKRIFVHCTAGSQKQTLKDLLNEFKAKGWKKPGYHYTVFPDGEVKQLLPEAEVSNGVQGYNSTSINVSYVGGIDNKGRATDNRTEAQKASLLRLLKELKTRYPNAHIMGHRDIWGKDKSKWKKMCPCFDAEAEYADILKEQPVKKEEPKPVEAPKTGPKAKPELYVMESPRDYTGFLKDLKPW
jgi:N-acetylmuramoyl-L-alanine amidase